MNLTDSHAHVDVSDFDADRDAMLERARATGVRTLLAIGNGPEIESWARRFPTPKRTIGFTRRPGFIRTRLATPPTRTMQSWIDWRGTRA